MVIFHSYVSLPEGKARVMGFRCGSEQHVFIKSGGPYLTREVEDVFLLLKMRWCSLWECGASHKKNGSEQNPWPLPLTRTNGSLHEQLMLYVYSYIYSNPTKKDRWKKCDDFSRFRTLLLFYLLRGYPCRCTKTSMASHPWRLNSLMCSMLGMFFFQKKNGGIKIYKNQILKSTSIASKWSQSHSMCNNASPSLAKPTLR
jgi:hypothetical protein